MQETNLNFLEKIQKIYNNLNFQNELPLNRSQALKNALSYGFPTPKQEHWKYSSPIFLNKYNFIDNTSNILNEENIDFSKYLNNDIDSYNLIVLNGTILTNKSNLPQNIELLNLEKSLKNSNQLINYFDIILNNRKTVFSEINTALFRDGIYLRIPKNTNLDKPLAIYYFNEGNNSDAIINLRRNIICEKNVEVTILEYFINLGNYFTLINSVGEIFVDENSIVNHLKLQNYQNTSLIDNFNAVQKRYSNFTNFTFTDEGKYVRNDLNAILDDENCETHLLGVYIGDNDNLIDNHTFVDHAKPNSFSNENYRGILFDKSTGVFNGKILVRKDAQKTNAYQSNKNILCSKDATINSKPELEIYADDVKCSHGATSGALDKNLIFYLQSRGIERIKAESLLMNSFLSEVVSELKNQEIKKYLQKLIRLKLNDDLHYTIDMEELKIDN